MSPETEEKIADDLRAVHERFKDPEDPINHYSPPALAVHPAEQRTWANYYATGEWDESLRLRYDPEKREWVPCDPGSHEKGES